MLLLGLLVLFRLILLLLILILLLLILIRHNISSCKVLHNIAEFFSAVIFCTDFSTLFTEIKNFGPLSRASSDLLPLNA